MEKTTALAVIDPAADLQLARTLAASNLLPTALRKRPEDVLVTVLAGRELGLSPMAAIRGIHVIEGKPVMSADLMVALCLRLEACEYFTLIESTDARATYETKRRGQKPIRMSFTIEQAKAAGLAGKDNWRKYPAAMLRARCASALTKTVYPDAFFGCYDLDEADDIRRAAPRIGTAPESVKAQPEDGVVEGEVMPWDAAQAPAAPAEPAPVEKLTAAIAGATSPDALQALVSEIKALPKEQQDALRESYSARRAALTANGSAGVH